MQGLNPNLKGNVAEAAITLHALRAGVEVLKPQAEHVRYDLALDIGGRFFRVQCKSAKLVGGAVVITLRTCRRVAGGYARGTYTRDEIDLVAAYCHENETCWLVPIWRIEGVSQFHIRLEAARNNQRAAVNFAADYEFAGAVAQLARARRWQRRGRRFESDQLHPESSVVGAEEFGAHTPRFVQRAKAGESFLITRRGKPMASLVPPDRLGAIEPPGGDLAQPSLLEEPPGAEAA